MFEWFPTMTDAPEGKHIALGGMYWPVYIWILPFILALVGAGGEANATWMSFIFCAYFVMNFIAVALIFRSYLADSFWNVRLYKKRFFCTVGSGLAALAVVEGIIILLGYNVNIYTLIYETPMPLPVADTLLQLPVSLCLMINPIIVSICLITVVPVTMCCLYYAVGFASICSERPWLAYLVVALIALVPAYFQSMNGYSFLTLWLITLPFHMLACWVYEQTDTIWGPILFHAAANLLGLIWFYFSTKWNAIEFIGDIFSMAS